MENLRQRQFEKEFSFATSRSSGPGGQNVNKVASKVELRFSIPQSTLLTDEEKNIIIAKLKNKINHEGELIIVSQETRSQLKNKQKAEEIFYSLLQNAFLKKRIRKKTHIPFTATLKRLTSKKIRSARKTLRNSRGEE